MSIKQVFCLFVVSILLSSCSFVPAPTRTSTGTAVFVNIKEGKQQTNNNINSYTKIGKACTSNILYLVNIGDSSIEAAKIQGNIKEVKNVSKENNGMGLFVLFIPFVFSHSCTVVYGN